MNRPQTPHRAWLALPLAVLAFGLAACGPAAQPSASQVPAAEEKPQYGGTLVFAGVSAPANLDVLTNAGTGDGRNGGGIYNKLVEYDYADPRYKVDYKMVPGLAERWDLSPDGKTYTFFLRKGVKWHDGEEFTAADVAYTYQRIIKEKGPLSGYLSGTEKVEAVDPSTVKVTNRAANVTFLLGLGASNMGIQPKHVADKGMDLTKTAIGTGPYKLESFDPKTKTVWVKNPNYWQQGLPYVDKWELIWSLDKPAMLAAFTVTKVDNTFMLDKVDVNTVTKTNPNFQLFKEPFTPPALVINLEHPAFKDVRVRRAINLAVDRQELIKINGAGEGELTCFLPISKTGWCFPGFEQTPGFRQPKDQDLAEAKRLLAEAGYPSGFEFRIVYSNQDTQGPPLSELLATQMTRIGLKAVVDGRDRASFNDLLARGAYDTIVAQPASWPDTTDKSNIFNFFSTRGTYNKHGAGNAELDKLIEQQEQTVNAEERKKMWHQMERIVLDNVWSIPFTANVIYYHVQPWVKGPAIGSGNWHNLNPTRAATTWLDQKLLPQR